MKDFFVRIFDKADQFVSKAIGPVIDKVVEFLSKGKYTIYAVIGLFLSIVILIGLIRWLFKRTKSFIIIAVIFGAVLAMLFIFAS